MLINVIIKELEKCNNAIDYLSPENKFAIAKNQGRKEVLEELLDLIKGDINFINNSEKNN